MEHVSTPSTFSSTTILGAKLAVADQWAKTESRNKDVKIFLGVPASPTAASPASYVDPDTLGELAKLIQDQYSSFGGVIMCAHEGVKLTADTTLLSRALLLVRPEAVEKVEEAVEEEAEDAQAHLLGPHQSHITAVLKSLTMAISGPPNGGPKQRLPEVVRAFGPMTAYASQVPSWERQPLQNLPQPYPRSPPLDQPSDHRPASPRPLQLWNHLPSRLPLRHRSPTSLPTTAKTARLVQRRRQGSLEFDQVIRVSIIGGRSFRYRDR
ncbi:Chitinase 2 [Marasmius tenuissimus]|nr:Chitinase 2 [Marasmius tenuissimus]